ncbi:hypothetical protein EMIHUDRAFT_419469 [Emiliania huxleyi CCMP1516]|uniref:Protein kinase domain-containing protein n=2 Tax=Emiliania huxleyi TaxID=2903 RepID=A0A0D3IZ93_EMIH1|nr:hypothetical protein EMIHUDRAFT_419469 [Emiliania huxleyi CCMP1516]EOD16578.1 hypothetical protein EMIHUDRAFT_419469 [Emiliania huxleyi CCMP1516]|eukprot:XP_005769007.1 hypothetical protein EMIHUDRAFT_419469 [Emiliania huxleyi CCMP1516]
MSHATNCFLALKRMKKSEVVRLKQVEHILNEKSVLAETSHPFIVDMYATTIIYYIILCYTQDERSLYMLLEYVPGGELFSHLRKAAASYTATPHTQRGAARACRGRAVMAVQHLHGIGVVYRDLKPENLLLDGRDPAEIRRDPPRDPAAPPLASLPSLLALARERGFLKLVDFGFAKRVADRTWTLCGTPEMARDGPRWLERTAPALFRRSLFFPRHNFAVDWWALGIAGYPPFFDDSPFGIYQKILAGRHECPRHFEPTAKELIRKLLTADRTKRIGSTKNGGGAEEIKKQKWYRGLNWAALYNKTMEPYIAPDVSSSDDTSHYEKFADSIEESGPLLAITKDTALFGSFTGAFGSI